METLILLGKLAGVWAFIAGFKTWVIDPVRKHFLRIDKIEATLAQISAELSRNGGSSTKDGVVEIRELVHTITERQRIVMHDDRRGIFEANELGEIVYVNQAYCHALQRTTHECLGYGWKSFVYEGDRDRVFHEWDSCIRDGREFDMDYRYRLDDGRVLLASVKAVVMRGGGRSKRCIGYIGFVQPIQTMQDEHKTKRHHPV